MAAPICLTLAGGPNTLNIRPRVDMREKKRLTSFGIIPHTHVLFGYLTVRDQEIASDTEH